MKNNGNMNSNRIEYIVRGNPTAADKLLRAEGFQLDNKISTLLQAAKQYVKEDGEKAVQELLKIHPEKTAILSATGHFDHFGGCGCSQSSFNGSGCGCKGKSNFSGDPEEQEMWDRIKNSRTEELKDRYYEVLTLLKQYPNDELLEKEKELIWGKIKPRSKENPVVKETQKKHPEDKGNLVISKRDVLMGTLLLGVGVILYRLK